MKIDRILDPDAAGISSRTAGADLFMNCWRGSVISVIRAFRVKVLYFNIFEFPHELQGIGTNYNRGKGTNYKFAPANFEYILFPNPAKPNSRQRILIIAYFGHYFFSAF